MHACVIRGFHLRADATEPLSEEDIIQAALREEDVAGEEDGLVQLLRGLCWHGCAAAFLGKGFMPGA